MSFEIALRPSRGWGFVIALLAFALGAVACWAAENGLEPLTIVTASGGHAFQVEIANDEASREHGLMDRRYLPPNRGMLFEFEANAPEGFWMKDTLIPLDMIFIAPDGTVTHIAENAAPLSQTVIYSGGPCLGVLEVNGGVAEKIGLKVGDKVRAAFFSR